MDHNAIKARNGDLPWDHYKFLVLPSKSRTFHKLSEALKLQSAAARRPVAGLAESDFKRSKTVQLTTASGEIFMDALVLNIVSARVRHQIRQTLHQGRALNKHDYVVIVHELLCDHRLQVIFAQPTKP